MSKKNLENCISCWKNREWSKNVLQEFFKGKNKIKNQERERIKTRKRRKHKKKEDAQNGETKKYETRYEKKKMEKN